MDPPAAELVLLVSRDRPAVKALLAFREAVLQKEAVDIRSLAKTAGVSKSTVERMIDELSRGGLLEVDHGPGGRGPSRYEFRWPPNGWRDGPSEESPPRSVG